MSAFRNLPRAVRLAWRAARWPLLVQYALTAVAGALIPLAAWTSKELFDAIADGGGSSRVLPWAVAVAASAASFPLVALVIGHLGQVVGAKLTMWVENELFTGVSRNMGLGPFERAEFLDRLRLAEQSAAETPSTVVQVTASWVQAAVTSAGLLVGVLAVWPPMTLLLLAVIAAHVVAEVRLSRLEVRTTETMSETARLQFLYRTVLTDARSVKEVRLFGTAGFFQDRMLAALGRSTAAQLRTSARSTSVSAWLTLVSGLCVAIGVVVVSLRAASGGLSVGDVTLFIAAAGGLGGALQGVVRDLGRARTTLVLFDSYLSIVEGPQDLLDGSGPTPPLTGTLELRDVWFRYGPDTDWVLRGLDLTVRAGESLALVGLNGAGKSTLVKLLCRLYDPERGAVLWNGVDLRDLEVAGLRRRIAVTFQDFMPYDLSVRENVAVGDLGGATDGDAVARAARLAGADSFITKLPQGYDTMLSRSFDLDGVPGVLLSGGQWQRLALARSFVREDADLLILDEPSSGLDAEAEAEVQASLRRHREGRTSVLISHRLSTLREADRIVVLGQGVIAESGTHDELLAQGGEYARLFRLQGSGYRDDVVEAAP